MIAVREKTGAAGVGVPSPLGADGQRQRALVERRSRHHQVPAVLTRPPRPATQAELDSFFEEVAFTNGSFKDLLLSNVGFVNKDNAAIYGLDATPAPR